ncbi:BRCA1-associated RING domain protein 1 [Entomortierella beljakovae]|nr:BRCA1-associated RING domain protein 1 [Entomortierella beljakovae]
MENPVSTHCNHRYCRQCIHHALDRTDGCPLCKAHVTKRSLNKIEHLENLIEAFNKLKGAFESEDGFTLSQAPRIMYNADPMENLSQLFPYPEKSEASSSHSKLKTPPQTKKTQNSSQNDFDPSTSRKTPTPPLSEELVPSEITQESTSRQYLDKRSSADMDLDIFDVNLDSISPHEAACLAQNMLYMMSSITLNEPCSDIPPLLPEQSKPSRAQSKTRNVPNSQQTESLIVKSEDLGDSAAAAPPPNFVNLVTPKTEATHFKINQTATDPVDCAPTQPPSKEVNIIISATCMTFDKKQELEIVAKALKTKTNDDISAQPSHIVMDINEEKCQSGSGRTVKYFLGVLRSCWVLRFEWIVASRNAGYWVDETPYQIYDNEFGCNAPKKSRVSHSNKEPPLFASLEVQLSGTFKKPSKDEIELMIRTGGGMVVPQLFRDTRFAKSISGRNSNKGDHVDELRHILLFSGNDGVVHLKKVRTDIQTVKDIAKSLGKRVETAQSRSLLDCIAQYDMSKLIESTPDDVDNKS